MNLRVRCKSGQTVPKEGGGSIGEEPVSVELSHYYRTLLADGSLERVAESDEGEAQ